MSTDTPSDTPANGSAIPPDAAEPGTPGLAAAVPSLVCESCKHGNRNGPDNLCNDCRRQAMGWPPVVVQGCRSMQPCATADVCQQWPYPNFKWQPENRQHQPESQADSRWHSHAFAGGLPSDKLLRDRPMLRSRVISHQHDRANQPHYHRLFQDDNGQIVREKKPVLFPTGQAR